jgi:ATP-dependent DNA helicase RecG
MAQQIQSNLFGEPTPTVEALLARREDQWFDRKSVRIEARALADSMIGFANADGGRIVVGIHSGEVEGVNSSPDHLNDLIQAAIDHSSPPVRHTPFFLDCTDRTGQPNRLLLLDVEASEQIHRNRRNECYLRVGDENRRLSLVEERELAFDKGEAIFDNTIVPDLTLEDLNASAIQEYADKIGSSNIPSLLRSRGIYYDIGPRRGVTQAGWLLFGEVPPIWSYIRYLRYTGTVIETGARSNIADDVRLEGTIPALIEQAKVLLDDRLRAIRLTAGGKFDRVLVLPEFAWLEAIVNAVTHRSYSLQGDGVRIREFDDRLEVESPGRLPGLVRVQNIRNSRFSRNPHIARVLAEMTGYVRELNEGVQRMFEEMERFGLRPPEFRIGESNVRVILYKQPDEGRIGREQEIAAQLALLRKRLGEERLQRLLANLKSHRQMPPREIAALLGITLPTVRKYMQRLEAVGLVRQERQSPTDPTVVWAVTGAAFWSDVDVT